MREGQGTIKEADRGIQREQWAVRKIWEWIIKVDGRANKNINGKVD